MNPFSTEKANKAAASGRHPIQNAQHFVPIILHSAFSILHSKASFFNFNDFFEFV